MLSGRYYCSIYRTDSERIIQNEIIQQTKPDKQGSIDSALSDLCIGENKRLLRHYLEHLSALESGKKIIDSLKNLSNCGLKLEIKAVETNDPLEKILLITDISDGKVQILLPTRPPSEYDCISIPILCRDADAFVVKDILSPMQNLSLKENFL